ncbi:hypothetical protein NBRC10512v2_005377 [Rhodotorula toruloides]
MTVQFCDLPAWMTTRLFQHYLLHGPTTYLHAKPEEVKHLEDLVDNDDEIPPIPTDVKVSRDSRDKSGRSVGQATYSSRTEAERAKKMFDGAKVLGRLSEPALVCFGMDVQREVSSWRDRVTQRP